MQRATGQTQKFTVSSEACTHACVRDDDSEGTRVATFYGRVAAAPQIIVAQSQRNHEHVCKHGPNSQKQNARHSVTPPQGGPRLGTGRNSSPWPCGKPASIISYSGTPHAATTATTPHNDVRECGWLASFAGRHKRRPQPTDRINRTHARTNQITRTHARTHAPWQTPCPRRPG